MKEKTETILERAVERFCDEQWKGKLPNFDTCLREAIWEYQTSHDDVGGLRKERDFLVSVIRLALEDLERGSSEDCKRILRLTLDTRKES